MAAESLTEKEPVPGHLSPPAIQIPELPVLASGFLLQRAGGYEKTQEHTKVGLMGHHPFVLGVPGRFHWPRPGKERERVW